MEELRLTCEHAFYKAALKMALDELHKYHTAIEICYQWKPDITYEKGDCVRWHDLYFVCVRKHKSKKEFNPKYWRIE